MVDDAPLRVVFLGTPEFALPTLDAILRSRHTVVGVVTQPDRPRGRGQRMTDAPVKMRARDTGLPLLQPGTVNDPGFLSALTGLRPDIGVVAAYGKILSEAVLAVPPAGMINVHASLLPRYRGAAPVHRAIMAAESETGVTIMRVVKALDAGPMLAAARRPIGRNDTSLDVERDLAAIGASLLVATLDRLARGAVAETPQEESAASYARRLTKDDGLVDWSRPAGPCARSDSRASSVASRPFVPPGQATDSVALGRQPRPPPALHPGRSSLRAETICTSPRVPGSWSSPRYKPRESGR